MRGVIISLVCMLPLDYIFDVIELFVKYSPEGFVLLLPP